MSVFSCFFCLSSLFLFIYSLVFLTLFCFLLQKHIKNLTQASAGSADPGPRRAERDGPSEGGSDPRVRRQRRGPHRSPQPAKHRGRHAELQRREAGEGPSESRSPASLWPRGPLTPSMLFCRWWASWLTRSALRARESPGSWSKGTSTTTSWRPPTSRVSRAGSSPALRIRISPLLHLKLIQNEMCFLIPDLLLSSDYTDLSMGTVTQTQAIPYTGPISLLVSQLRSLAGGSTSRPQLTSGSEYLFNFHLTLGDKLCV